MEIGESPKMKVIIYTRVSTKEQVEGYSLSYQEKFCKEYAERQGWSVVEVFQEQGESAKTADRTQLQKLLDFCHKNKGKVDILLVHKLDRFARNTADHQAVRAILVRYGVKIRSVTEQIDDNPAGKLMENIFSAVAQFDNDVRSERTTEGMKEKARQGYWTWKAPLGYKNTPSGMLIDEIRAPLIKKAFETYGMGGYTVKVVAQKLNKWGLRTDKGNKITPQTLIKIFNNKLYFGVIDKWNEINKGIHEPIITEELFYRVQAIRLGKSVQVLIPRTTNNPLFPLKNIAKCNSCGKSLTASQSTGRSKKYAYYHCICGAVRVNKEELENRFYEYLKLIQPNDEIKKIFQLLLIEVWKRKHSEAAKAVEEIDNEIFRLKELKKRLLQKNLEGIVSDKDYREQVEVFNDNLTIKEIERTEYRNNETSMDHIISLAESLFENVSSVWFESSFTNKQRFQTLMFPTGLSISNADFGTTTLGLPFSLIRDFAGDETTLVTPREFESRLVE